jgi:hypothetical protein
MVATFEADSISNRIVTSLNNYNNNGGRIYVLNGSTGALVTTISHPSPFNGTTAPTWSSIGEYGLAVGNGKVAAANIDYYKSGTTTQVGQVWVWNIDGTNQIAISNPDPDNFNQFGYKISIADSKIAISAFRNIGSTATRKVWIYDLSGNLIRTLEPPANDSTLRNNWGGSGCFLGDNRFAVVDDDNAEGGYSSGAVYLYDYNGNFIKKLRAADTDFGTTRRFFGYTGQQINVGVTIKNQKIYVAYGPRNAIQPGGINIYDINGNFERKLHGLSAAWVEAGFTVLDNDNIVVSDTSTNNYDGGMYIYSLNNVKNLSSSSYTGTVNGEAVFNSAGYFVFDGINDYIEHATNSFPLTGNVNATLEAWIYYTTTFSSPFPTEAILAYGNGPSTGDTIALGIYDDSRLGMFFNGGTNIGTLAGALSPYKNTWCHVVGTKSAGSTGSPGGTQTITLYINGVQSQLGSWASAITPNISSRVIRLGRWTNDSSPLYFNGRMGEARIYSRVLTASEVSKNFNATRGKYGV